MSLSLRLAGAVVMMPRGFQKTELSFCNGVIAKTGDREVDLSGFMILPGIVDVHGDAFEKHIAPRRGAVKDLARALLSNEAELAANGITTAVMAQFCSWEGGMRSPEFAEKLLCALSEIATRTATDMRVQLRLEVSLVDYYDEFLDLCKTYGVQYVVFNDHLPHDALFRQKKPPRLTGQALRAGKSPESHYRNMLALHSRMENVPHALKALARKLSDMGVLLGSHDDRSEGPQSEWHGMGVEIAEFPETEEAAKAARSNGASIVLGAPNAMRGGSHNGNISAVDLISAGLCDALASDYHYPSLANSAFALSDAGVLDLTTSWKLISSGPAKLLGLNDRGSLARDMRADLVVVDQNNRDICATISNGRISHLKGEVAERFIG